MRRVMIYRDKCRHFNGIQNEECTAGVNYRSVRDSSKPGTYEWPCLDTGSPKGPATTVCSKRSLLTQQEHAEEEREINKRVDAALLAIKNGKCHVCGADAEPSTIHGRCRYAACGHRIGQTLVQDDDDPSPEPGHEEGEGL